MHRIDAPDATSDHRFTEGNPTIPIPATTVTADWLNAVQEEIVAVLAAAKAVPDKADNTQLADAITGLIASNAAAPQHGHSAADITSGTLPAARGGTGRTDGKAAALVTARTIDGVSFDGTANCTHYVTCSTAAATAAKTASLPGFKLEAGAAVQIVFDAVNSAANPTLNVQSTGAKPIKYCGASIEVGNLAKGQVYTMIYSGGAWQIVGGMSPWSIGQIEWWEDEFVRPGFLPANANIIKNFAATYPQMAAYLSTSHGAKRLFASLNAYEAAHDAAWATLADGSKVKWDNVGGVAKFWWDKKADTLLMPDLTGMLREVAGLDSLGVGGVHGDGIRSAKGGLAIHSYMLRADNVGGVFGGLALGGKGNASHLDGAYGYINVGFDISRVMPVGNKIAPRAWGALACVYLGRPAS